MMSKYWSEMNIIKNKDDNHNNNLDHDHNNDGDDFIISKEPPIKYNNANTKINLIRGIKESEYSEVANFYQKYNRMVTGNTTLLPVDELKRYLSLKNISLLMRAANGMLIGTIISILLPVKNSNIRGRPYEVPKTDIITHGCTTFLAVHPSLRKMGLCMALIRGLIEIAYEEGIYCDYHAVAFELGANSVPLYSWYRPINIERSKELGFLYTGWNDPRASTKIRLKYSNVIPKDYTYTIVNKDNNNINSSLQYYLSLVTDKLFSFWPDEDLWSQWIESFPTYIICKDNKYVGIVSLNTVYCSFEKSQEIGKLLFPIICEGEMDKVMKVLCGIAKDLKHDVLYLHQHGAVNEKALESINSIKTTTKLWFSLYNNRIDLKSDDIHVPLL